MAESLPTPNVTPNWGDQLNQWLLASHNADGTLAGVSAQSLADLEFYFRSGVTVTETPDALGNDIAKVTAKVVEVAAKGGGILQFLPGVYRFDDIEPCSGLWVRGSGMGVTIFKRPDGGSGNHGIWNVDYQGTQRNDLRFSDFKLDGNKALAPHGRGLNIEKTMRCIVDHVWSVDNYEGGINIGGQNTSNTIGKFWITRCLSENNGTDPNGWGQISCTGGDDILISHNMTTNDSGDGAFGIDCEPNGSWNMTRVHIDNNIVRNGGIKCDIVGSLIEIMLTNNEADARASAGNGFGLGFTCGSGVAVGTAVLQSNKIICPGSTSAGIHAVSDDADDLFVISDNTVVEIVGNVAGSRTNCGLYFYPGGKAVIRNNHFAAPNNTHATLGAGIVPYNAAVWDRTQAHGNTFSPEIIVPIMSTVADVLHFQSGDIVATASLPVAAAARDGLQLIEDAGAGNRNLIIYAGGERFRIDGGANV